MHARGQLDEAARSYDALLSLKPGHQAWYTRECCVYLWNNLRRPWREFSPDAELDPEFKVKHKAVFFTRVDCWQQPYSVPCL